MSWASKRQFKYSMGFIVVVLLIIFAIIYPMLFKNPTCTDKKQNGDETGVDCGGSCSLMCKKEIVDPVILWSRAFPVTGSNFNLVAYVENRNKSSAVAIAPYEFRIYDTNNKLIGRREGQTFIPPNQQFAVFEPRFDAGQSEIKSVTFEFSPSLIWVKKTAVAQTLPVFVNNVIFDNNKDNPNLLATINNQSIYDLPEFDVIAVLYDKDNNAINASKTHKDGLSSNNSMQVIFTWPEAITTPPVLKDIMVMINPFSLSL